MSVTVSPHPQHSAEIAFLGAARAALFLASQRLSPPAFILEMPVRVVVLDCGGVTNADCGAGGWSAVAEAAGVSADAVQRGHKLAWAKARSDPSFHDYWPVLLEEAGVGPAERTSAELVAACERALGRGLRVSFSATLDLVRRLKGRGIVVGMISNHLVVPPLFDYCADGAELHALVSDASLLVVSQAVGCAKPHAAIYRLFWERLEAFLPGVQPSELVLVDDKEANVEAARAEGWLGVVYKADADGRPPLDDTLGALGLPVGT